MRVPVSQQVELEAEKVLVWGNRLLSLALFVFVVIAMFYVDFPPTLPFTGAILCFFFIARIWVDYSGEEREITESISALYGDMYSWFISVK